MDSRQEIGLGASVAASQAYATSTARPDSVAQADSSVTAASASGSAGTGQESPGRAAVNPRTVLDPDLYVNVAQYSYGDGSVEFQVPSRSQLEAYQRNQAVEASKAEAERVETRDGEVRTREAGDGDGVGDESAAAVGTVTAAVVGQTQAPPPPPDPQRNGASEGIRTSPGGTRRAVELEA